MSLEDTVLKLVGDSAITWDGLRAECGVSPGELDAAIRVLERTRSITRDRGRFYLPGAKPVTKQTATAEASNEPAEKICKGCKETKPIEEFHKHPASKDGHDARCKACKKASNAAYREKQLGQPARLPGDADVLASAVRSSPGGPLMILHFADGVRLGPMITSETGLAQMPFHVDLSGRQLDELCTWWASAKAAA